MSDIAIKIEHVSKEYRLGTIGGGTLRGDLQSLWAKMRHQEDPNSLVGTGVNTYSNDRFLALNDVSFEVRKGEALGIIGHNGAGKSTLLKLLSRVTAPTDGTISYNGRIASMLEVGTGFHPELTGRENVYMNGAILGMTKAEIDKKFDQIVAFAEMEKFIDTPVKRYSSGMYVKLAFAVAAHLDSEIMVMDEVLAVGDMKFQQKCLGKMGDAAGSEGKTVLYVSHNMNTIRQLCTRCIVLDHGRIVFDGDTEAAIGIYSNYNIDESCERDYREYTRPAWLTLDNLRINCARYLNAEGFISRGETVEIEVEVVYDKPLDNINMRFELLLKDDTPVATVVASNLPIVPQSGPQKLKMKFDLSALVAGEYKGFFTFFTKNSFGTNRSVDCVPSLLLRIEEIDNENYIDWNRNRWGSVQLPPPVIEVV